MQNKDLNPVIDLRSQYEKENLEKTGKYKIKEKKYFYLKDFKKIVTFAGFFLFILTIYLNYFLIGKIEKTEAKKILSMQEKIRLERLEKCSKYAKVKEIYGQDAVVRCATFATIVFAFESNFGKSKMCQNQKNCYGMKGNGVEYPAGFITFNNFSDGTDYFAKKYFQWHYKKKTDEFVNSWSMTDRESYKYFFKQNFTKIYNENLKLWKEKKNDL